uniref:A2 mating type protein n=1 Tax=Heterobasidion parviporum TaxID=207832 RepID=S5RWC0_9AGAM|nr:a2 mating type protein [Heterobasidion parviporum]
MNRSLPSPSQAMSSVPKNCLPDYLNDFSRVRSILSQLRLRVTRSNARLSLPFTDRGSDADSSFPPTALSAEVSPLFPLPHPLAYDLLALGLPPATALYLSSVHTKAAIRLKAKFEIQLYRADRACAEITYPEGIPAPRSYFCIRTIYSSHFKQTVKSWAEIGMLSTQQRLLTTSLKNRFQVSLPSLRPVASKIADFGTLPHMDRKIIEVKVLDTSHKMEPSSPRISTNKKTEYCAGLATRRSAGRSRCHGTPGQTIFESTRPTPVIKADPDTGPKPTEGAAIKGAESRDLAGKNHSPTSWDLTSFIHDFDGLSIRDRSETVSSGNEEPFVTCKVSPSERISNLSKLSSSTINRLPISAGVQSTASSSRLRSSIQSPYDGDSHSASPLSISNTIRCARPRKIAPCPNRERSTPSVYRGSDVFFPHQTNDMTVTSSATNATELSDPTSHRPSPSASTHTRRRKIAPLPPRHPSTTTTDIAVIISPDVRRSSQRPSHKLLGSRQSTTGTPGRLTGHLSRSPSLTSLSSDESSLSCSDELETPPSSPTLPSTILPTTTLEKFSVSPDEYRFLSAAFFHNISPAPHLLKAEIHRPRTLTFSARDEDSPRFPFSR